MAKAKRSSILDDFRPDELIPTKPFVGPDGKGVQATVYELEKPQEQVSQSAVAVSDNRETGPILSNSETNQAHDVSVQVPKTPGSGERIRNSKPKQTDASPRTSRLPVTSNSEIAKLLFDLSSTLQTPYGTPTVRLPYEIYDELNYLKYKTKVPISNLVAQIIKQWLDANKDTIQKL